MLRKRNTGHIYSTHSEQLPSMIHNIKQSIKNVYRGGGNALFGLQFHHDSCPVIISLIETMF